MAFSADQLARLNAGHIDYQYQVFVSGGRDTVAMQDITEGAAYTAFPATTLNGALSNVDTTITVASTAGFDSSGYILIADDGTNPAEPIQYTGKTGTTFTGLTRSLPTAHLTGTAVSKWIEITDIVTGIEFQETLQRERGSWAARLSGVLYNSRLLAQNNACLVLVRWFPTSAGDVWSSWEVFFQGYIGAGSVTDDYRQGAEWEKPVRGIDFYLENADAPARRYGRSNLAIDGITTASTALSDASIIGHSGEVFGSPSLDSGNLVDDSMSTVYCSVDVPQIVNGSTSFPASLRSAFVSEVGFGPVGTGDDGAYFVLWAGGLPGGNDASMNYYTIANRQTTFPPGEAAQPSIYTKNVPGLPTITVLDRIIICRNREVFERWAGPQQVEVLEWRGIPYASTFNLRADGDSLSLVSNQDGSSVTYVTWGDDAVGTAWEGLPALSEGQALYRVDFSVNNQDDTDWALTDTPVPGRNAQADTQVYASVAIPEMAITLAADIAPGVGTITVTPSTTGLNQSGGTIQIDAEQIPYTAATSTTLTGCTVASSHSAGAVIWAVDDDLLAHKTEMIGQIGWKRRRVIVDDELIVPSDFTIWTSRDASPSYPSSDPSVTTWQVGWSRQQTVHGGAGIEWSTPASWPGTLARHVMIVCERMTGDTRFLLNEIYALRAAGYDPASTVAETGGDIAEQMLTDFGLDSALIDVTAFGPVGTHLVTSRGRYMARLAELAGMMGGQVVITRDNRVRFERSPWHPVEALPEVAVALTRSYGTLVKLDEGRRNVISQVVLKANNPETGETFTVQYPPTARTLGSSLDVERAFYWNENEGRYLAQLIYRQANSEDGVSFAPSGHGDGFRIGQRVTLTWNMDSAGDLYSGSNFIVTGVSVQMEHPADGPKVCNWSVSMKEYIF